MKERELEAERLRTESAGMDDRAFIAEVARRYSGKIVFASSLGAEDQVLTHLIVEAGAEIPILTLDTGRLPQETYELIDATRRRFGVEIGVYFPDAEAVESLVRERGPNLFYEGIELRKACCRVRKVLPLERALEGRIAWLTGMRRSQSVTRGELHRVEYDAANDMVKINPLIAWSREQVWEHIRAHTLPYNALHDKGFPSIGCAPCTRAVQPGEDERAGRWWWERPENRECGIHVQAGAVVRVRVDPVRAEEET